MNIFVSVGSTANPAQESFVRAIEDRLRAEGLNPLTVGRTHFTADSPFIGVNKLMDNCRGILVIALERLHVGQGTEKRGGPAETPLQDIKLSTPWNQIEAALAYSRKLPLLVIVEQGVRQDGLLEKGFDWYVIKTPMDQSSLATPEFNGVLSSWKDKVASNQPKTPTMKSLDLPPSFPNKNRPMAHKSMKDRIENSPVLFILGALLTGFVAGIGSYEAILGMAKLQVVSKESRILTVGEKVISADEYEALKAKPNDSQDILAKYKASTELSEKYRALVNRLDVAIDAKVKFELENIRRGEGQMPPAISVFIQQMNGLMDKARSDGLVNK